MCRELTVDEIHVIADKYGAAAHRLQLAGIDGVAIHGAHHYLIHQFLSANLNKRSDEYGGSLENRARFLHEVLDAIRKYCGSEYPIMLRLSAEEYVGKYGQHLDETLKVFKWAEEWGVDLLDVSASGSRSHGSQSVEPPSFDQGWRKHLPKAAKQVVDIPVCAVSLVREPAYAEKLLEEGYTDFVGSARLIWLTPTGPGRPMSAATTTSPAASAACAAMRQSPTTPARWSALSTPRPA